MTLMQSFRKLEQGSSFLTPFQVQSDPNVLDMSLAPLATYQQVIHDCRKVCDIVP